MLNHYTAENAQTFCPGQDELRARWVDAGLVMANSPRSAQSCSMKIMEDVRKYAVDLGMTEEEVLKAGVEKKSKEFVENGMEAHASESTA